MRLSVSSWTTCWTTYWKLLFFLVASLVKSSHGDVCPVTVITEQEPCRGDGLQTESECHASPDCCWYPLPTVTVQDLDHPTVHCFRKGCSAGYFGWDCRFQCRCAGDEVCNSWTGECRGGCRPGRWGVGCLLDNECTYNDPAGLQYMGSKQKAAGNKTCTSWTAQRAYPSEQFPDKDFNASANFCRNPKPAEQQTWCYWRIVGNQKKWAYCTLRQCDCPRGRFGVNCVNECHCLDETENCNSLTGACTSGCNQHWTGSNCQDRQPCYDGYFGPGCDRVCHCHSTGDVCDKVTGACESGCARGWTGADCQNECPDFSFGQNCESSCNCRSTQDICNKTTGYCPAGCRTGYAGDSCQIVLPIMQNAPTVEGFNATSISIKWRQATAGPNSLKSYIVYYRLTSGPENSTWSSLPPTESTRLRAIVTNLLIGQNYQIRVAAVHSSGLYEGVPSPIVLAKTCGSFIQEKTNPLGNVILFTETAEFIFPMRLPARDRFNCKSSPGTTYNVYTIPALIPHSVASFPQDPSPTSSTTMEQWNLYQSGVTVPKINITRVDPYSNMSIGISFINSALLESPITEVFYVGKSGRVLDIQIDAVHGPNGSPQLVVRWKPPSFSFAVLYYVVSQRELHTRSCPSSYPGTAWTPMMDVDRTELELTDLSPFTSYQVKIRPVTQTGWGQVALAEATTLPSAPGPVDDLLADTLTSFTANVSWGATDCRKYNGLFIGYGYLLSTVEGVGEGVEAERLTNDTRVKLQGLTPATDYMVFVWIKTNGFEGPRTSLRFTTNESLPSAPLGITVDTGLVDSVVIHWSVPAVSNGRLTSYEILFNSISSPPLYFQLPANSTALKYNCTGLRPFTDYKVQVRAFTRVGFGPWSESVTARTDESVPSAPIHFINSSRTPSSAIMTWSTPIMPNGIITNYKLSCSPYAEYYVLRSARLLDVILDATIQQYVVTDLQPGTHYLCSVLAETRKGSGLEAVRVFWTVPLLSVNVSVPTVDMSKLTESSITIILQPVDSVDVMEDTDKFYRIVVESVHTSRARRSSSSSPVSPCGLPHAELVDHQRASLAGSSCYVAAELAPNSVLNEYVFVIGNNRTHGGYYNRPLDKNGVYKIWFGLVVTVDGVTASSYAYTNDIHLLLHADELVVPDSSTPEPNSSALTGAIVGALCALALIIIIVIVVIVVVIRRKNNNRMSSYRENIHSGGDTDPVAIEYKHEEKVLLRHSEGCEVSYAPSEAGTLLSPLRRSTTGTAVHRPVAVEDLWEYVAQKKISMGSGLKEEYEDITQSLDNTCLIAKKPENKLKNRYGNIIAYDHSRVVLECLPDDPHSDYINGNFIDGYRKPSAYVASQGPSKQTLSDIWRMTWQLNSTRIVMVTNLMEDGRHKCEQYWPENESKVYGDIHVENIDIELFADFKIRSFILIKAGAKKTVRQFHFTTWPDHGVPSCPTSLLAFRKKVESYAVPGTGPVIVHCSAGVGRTGTFIAIDYLLEQAKAEGQIDVFHCVKKMRENRVNMVQTQEQYVFVYDALLEALKSGDTSMSCTEFKQKYSQLTIPGPTGWTPIQEQYELLNTMSVTTETHGSGSGAAGSNQLDALLPKNISKNRVKDIVPFNKLYRPYLLTYINGSTDYINAVFIDAYKQRDAYIVTQAPLPTTISDFWAMIVDHDCKTIVMMNEQDPTDRTLCNYFPMTTSPLPSPSIKYGPFTVQVTAVDTTTYADIVVRDITVSHDRKGSTEPVKVRHFQYRGWPLNEPLPKSRSSVISLLVAIEKWQQRSGNGVVVVHCRDGASRSGLLCAVSYMVERLKVEQEIDVFQSVKHTRINRPQLVPTYDQYKFLYDMAIEYMDCFETYSNFK